MVKLKWRWEILAANNDRWTSEGEVETVSKLPNQPTNHHSLTFYSYQCCLSNLQQTAADGGGTSKEQSNSQALLAWLDDCSFIINLLSCFFFIFFFFFQSSLDGQERRKVNQQTNKQQVGMVWLSTKLSNEINLMSTYLYLLICQLCWSSLWPTSNKPFKSLLFQLDLLLVLLLIYSFIIQSLQVMFYWLGDLEELNKRGVVWVDLKLVQRLSNSTQLCSSF